MKANHFAQLTCILGLLAVGCATPSSDETAGPVEEAIEEQDLDLTVETLERSHGALRMTASMREASPDVAFTLGGSCDPDEVGRGLATRVRVVWTFTAEEMERVLECGMDVKARFVQDGPRRVHKKTTLALTPSVAIEDGPDEVRMQSAAATAGQMHVVFKGPMASARLFAVDAALDALPASPDDEHHLTSARFEIPRASVVRAVLSGRTMQLWTPGAEPAEVRATVQIGDVVLGAEEDVEVDTIFVSGIRD
jgi:hypothetical protein